MVVKPEDILDLQKIAAILTGIDLHAQNVRVRFLDLSSERHTIQAWLEFSNFLDDLHIRLEVKHDGYPLLPDEGAIEGGIEHFRHLVEYLESLDAELKVKWIHGIYINEGWEDPGEYVETLEYASLDDDATPTAIAPSWAARSRDWTFKESELEHSSYSNPFGLINPPPPAGHQHQAGRTRSRKEGRRWEHNTTTPKRS